MKGSGYGVRSIGFRPDGWALFEDVSAFWKNYLDKTVDDEILSVVQPFCAWRNLVTASPIWYPNLSTDVRKRIFRFATKVLKARRFEFEDFESCLK